MMLLRVETGSGATEEELAIENGVAVRVADDRVADVEGPHPDTAARS